MNFLLEDSKKIIDEIINLKQGLVVAKNNIITSGYYKVNGEYPDFEITHGGLECSCIAKRMTGLDIISIGSIIEDFHTANEKMYISSCEKTIKTLLAYLECENN